jgi:hypothetical protein
VLHFATHGRFAALNLLFPVNTPVGHPLDALVARLIGMISSIIFRNSSRFVLRLRLAYSMSLKLGCFMLITSNM